MNYLKTKLPLSCQGQVPYMLQRGIWTHRDAHA